VVRPGRSADRLVILTTISSSTSSTGSFTILPHHQLTT
jgi:hypothetical protein